jgi:antitoxin component YwqK of YwqJK toxin-antitoxin module
MKYCNIVICLFCLNANAQKLYKTTYLKFNNQEVNNKSDADLTQQIFYPDSLSKHYKLIEKYKNGNLRRVGEINEKLVPVLYFEGMLKRYYQNGKLAAKENFFRGQLKDSAIYYNEDGKEAQEGIYHFKRGEALFETRALYDEKGKNYLDDNGNGKVEWKPNIYETLSGNYENGYKDGLWITKNTFAEEVAKETYYKGNFIKGMLKDINGNEINYKELYNFPYSDGQSFMKSFGDGVCIPVKVLIRSSDYDGVVIYSFDIDRFGHTSNYKALTTVSEKTDKKALDFIQKRKWHPASYRGKTFDTFGFTYTVQFSLD